MPTVTAAPATTVELEKVKLTGLAAEQPLTLLSAGGLPALTTKLNALIEAHNRLLQALK